MKTFLLTGAAGVVGQALLGALPSERVISLVHKTPLGRVSSVALTGDVTRPNLGLSVQQYDELVGQVDYVIHSAASTNFNERENVMRRTNVDGTARVLEFAARAGAAVCLVGTAFAHLDELSEGKLPANAYEASKLEAERLVRTSSVRNVILRPSIIVGNSTDGSMSRFQGFHHMFDLILRGLMPAAPACRGAVLDFVPLDLLVATICAIAESDVSGEYWLTAGDRAPTFQDVMTIWVEHIQRLSGQRIRRPRIVEPDIVERLVIPVFMSSLPAGVQATLRSAFELIRYLNVEGVFPSSLADLEARLQIPPLPDPETTIIRNVEFWARSRRIYGGRPASPFAPL